MALDKGTPNWIPVRELSRNPIQPFEANRGNAQVQALGYFDAGFGRSTSYRPVSVHKRGQASGTNLVR
jgi:hypothetical protein